MVLKRNGARSKRGLIALVAGLGLAILAAPAASAAVCPGTVDGADFASKRQLRKLVKQENSFGQRFLGSPAHDSTIDWIEDEIRSIDRLQGSLRAVQDLELAAAHEGD